MKKKIKFKANTGEVLTGKVSSKGEGYLVVNVDNSAFQYFVPLGAIVE